MAVVAGIDEAGYGPLLGPLAVTATAFRLPDAAAEADLWELLRAAVARGAVRKSDRLRVADSKRLHHGEAGVEPLERNVLPFLAALGAMPENVEAFLRAVGAPQTDALAVYPWYRGKEQRLPRAAATEQMARGADCLRDGLAGAGAELCMVRLELLEAAEFSREVTACDNKAQALGGRVAALMRALWDRFAAEGLWLTVDKQGGRNDYEAFLLSNFYGCTLTRHCQGAERSSYTLRDGARRMTVTFEPKADARHLPVALASMFSKYARELMVEMLNEFWRQRVPGLRPTAGYLPDGQRFLEEIEPARQAENIPLELLKRCR